MLSAAARTVFRKNRGGAHHKAAPTIDRGILDNIFGAYQTELFDLGDYETISRSQACWGPGLAYRHAFYTKLLEASPSGHLPAGIVKASITRLLSQHPELNTSTLNNSCHAGNRLDRLTVAMTHLRRLANEPDRFEQCAAKTGGPDLAKLKALIAMMDTDIDADEFQTVTYDETGHRSLSREVSLDEEGYPKILQVSSPNAKGSRKLKPQVSLDAEGYPKMLSGSPSPRKQKRPAPKADISPSPQKQMRRTSPGASTSLLVPPRVAPGRLRAAGLSASGRIGATRESLASASAGNAAEAVTKPVAKAPKVSLNERLGYGAQPKAKAKSKASAKARATPLATVSQKKSTSTSDEFLVTINSFKVTFATDQPAPFCKIEKPKHCVLRF